MHVKIDLGLLFFAYISACGWCRERASSSSTNQMKYKNKLRLDPPRSSVLLVVCLYNLCSHRLLKVQSSKTKQNKTDMMKNITKLA